MNNRKNHYYQCECSGKWEEPVQIKNTAPVKACDVFFWQPPANPRYRRIGGKGHSTRVVRYSGQAGIGYGGGWLPDRRFRAFNVRIPVPFAERRQGAANGQDRKSMVGSAGLFAVLSKNTIFAAPSG